MNTETSSFEHVPVDDAGRALRAASEVRPSTVIGDASTERVTLLYRASDSLMNGLVWLDTHAPDWVRADIKQTRAALATALERRQ
jgi:hypothetical protein